MPLTLKTLLRCFVLLAAITAVLSISIGSQLVAGGADAQNLVPEPVDNMHHFMEYVFEPNYKRLKAGLAEAPADKAAWKAIKGDSLTLAEGTNLLLMRAPEKNPGAWKAMAVEVRGHGSDLFQAARKSDFKAARTSYESMISRCNACHKQFANGKYQLAP